MSNFKNSTAMEIAKEKEARKVVRVKDGKKGHYRSEAVGCSYSQRLAKDPLWVLLHS